jgi:hypothetical protein
MSAVDIYLVDISNNTIDIFERHFCCDYHRDFRDEIAIFKVFPMLLGTYSIFNKTGCLSLNAFKYLATHHLLENLWYTWRFKEIQWIVSWGDGVFITEHWSQKFLQNNLHFRRLIDNSDSPTKQYCFKSFTCLPTSGEIIKADNKLFNLLTKLTILI